MHRLTLALIFLSGFIISCGGSGSSSLISTSASYTSSGALASPFAESSGSSIVDPSRPFHASDFRARKEALQDLLDATRVRDCKFPINFTAVPQYAACYGPQLTLSGNHPDTGAAANPNSLPGGDLGIWNDALDDGTACTAAQITQLIDSQAVQAYLANLAGAAFRCYMATKKIEYPVAGGSKILTDAQLEEFSFGTVGVDDQMTLTGASVVAEDDPNSESTIYRYTLEGSMTDKELSKSIDFKAVIQYVLIDSNEFHQTISYNVEDSSPAMYGNCPGSGGMTYAGKQTIVQSSDTSRTVEFEHAEHCGKADVLDDDYGINPVNTYDAGTRPNGWANNYNYVLFSYNPDEDSSDFLVGNYIYAWQAGMGDTHTRVFNANIAAGAASGSGYFGYGVPVKTGANRSTGIGRIKGMICNWAGPNPDPHDTQIAASVFAQRQAMTKTAGIWTATTNDITYAPTNSCDYNPAGGLSNFRYHTSTHDFSNDVYSAAPGSQAATRDLYSFTPDTDGYLDFDAPERPIF